MEKKNVVEKLGFMLDCSRNAVMSVSQVKLLMKRLSKMGYNRFALYIEDTYEVDGEPYFGYLRGRYSQEELREIEDTAISLGMEFIPFIQVLVHLNALMQWPRFFYYAFRKMSSWLELFSKRWQLLIEERKTVWQP